MLAVCKAFDKISADKITLDSHFINDLGLDSLDHVEVIMAVEDEFGFEVLMVTIKKLRLRFVFRSLMNMLRSW